MASAFKSLFAPVGRLLGGDFDPDKPQSAQTLRDYRPGKDPAAQPLRRNANLYGSVKAEGLLEKWDKVKAEIEKWDSVKITREGRDTGNASSYVPHVGRQMANSEIFEVRRDLAKAQRDLEEALMGNLWNAPEGAIGPATTTPMAPPANSNLGLNPSSNVGKGAKKGKSSSSPVTAAASNIIGTTQTGTISSAAPGEMTGQNMRMGRRGRTRTLLSGFGGSDEALGG